MKKSITKLLAVIVVLLLNVHLLSSQSASASWTLTTNATPAITGSITSADMIIGSSLTGTLFGSTFNTTSLNWMRVATTSPNLPSTYSATSYVEFSIAPAANNNLTVTSFTANLGGGGTSNVKVAAYYSTTNFATTPGTALAPTSASYNSITYAATTATPIPLINTSGVTDVNTVATFSPLNIAVNNNTSLKIRIYAWSTSTLKYLAIKNVTINGTTVALSTDPTIAKTSGTVPTTVMATTSMTPIVYTYSNVADDNNVVSKWYTDDTYTTEAIAPTGLSLDKNTTAKTVTVNGTPTVAGTYYYKTVVNETNGNSVQGSVIVTPYVTPTPIISGGTNSNTAIKAGGSAITNIVYTLTNADGASITGLPTGLTANYSAGTYTISGTVDAGVSPAVYTYTVTATAMAGYTGSDITTTGKIVVKNSNAKQICYLVATTTQDVKDTKLFPALNESTNYIVILRTAASTAPAVSVYDTYDLIILNEIVAGTNAEALALKTIDKPILSFKSFTYTSGSNPRWGWGTPDNGKSDNGIVTVKQSSHPVFNGIDVSGGTLDVLTGVSGIGIQPTDVTLGGINVATAPKNLTPSIYAIAIHDVPATVRGVVNSKFLLIPFSNTNYDKISTNGLLLINNAIDYLINGTQFVAPSLNISSFNVASVEATIDQDAKTINATVAIGVDLSALAPTITLAGVGTTVSPASDATTNFTASSTTPVSYTVTDGINSKVYAAKVTDGTTKINEANASAVSIQGSLIKNPNQERITVYNAVGRIVATSNGDIQLNNAYKGAYIVKTTSGKNIKFVITK